MFQLILAQLAGGAADFVRKYNQGLQNGVKNREKTCDFLKIRAIFVQKTSIFTLHNYRLYTIRPPQAGRRRRPNRLRAPASHSLATTNFIVRTTIYKNSGGAPEPLPARRFIAGVFT
jgi:hypothetical protein